MTRYIPIPQVVDALDQALLQAFAGMARSGARLLFGLDVSGSMAWSRVRGQPELTARAASARFVLEAAVRAPQSAVVAFDTRAYPIPFSSGLWLEDMIEILEITGGGKTDCTQPVQWALTHSIEVDTFVILTDEQPGAQPFQAVNTYRLQTGRPARLILMALAANRFPSRLQVGPDMVLVSGLGHAALQAVVDVLKK